MYIEGFFMTDATNTPEEKSSQPNLQLADLAFVLQIIQTAAERGVFKVDEFKAVGECYERLFNFLASHNSNKNIPPKG